MAPQARFAYLQQELRRLCGCNVTEEDLLTLRGLIDTFLYNRPQKHLTEPIEEFGSTRDDFDEWGHDPGK